MDYIVMRLEPVLARLSFFVTEYSAYIIAVLSLLVLFSAIVGICLFRRMEKPAILGALPIVRELSLYAFLRLFALIPTKLICYVSIAILDILAFTAPGDGTLYLAFMIPLALILLIAHLAFSIRLSYAFNCEWYIALLIFLCPVVFVPVLAFGRAEYFGVN